MKSKAYSRSFKKNRKGSLLALRDPPSIRRERNPHAHDATTIRKVAVLEGATQMPEPVTGKEKANTVESRTWGELRVRKSPLSLLLGKKRGETAVFALNGGEKRKEKERRRRRMLVQKGIKSQKRQDAL